MSTEQWTVERALREGRADLLRIAVPITRDGHPMRWCAGLIVHDITRDGSDPQQSTLWLLSPMTNELLRVRASAIWGALKLKSQTECRVPQEPHYMKIGTCQPEPDGPPRDWPAIWRKQLREYIERAPMIPREYIDEVLRSIDAGQPWLPAGEAVAVVGRHSWPHKKEYFTDALGNKWEGK